MNMISEQIKDLRKTADFLFNAYFTEQANKMRQAADTIELLSAKPQAANCGGKWIDKDLLMESLIPILNENGDMYLAGRIIGLIDTQAEMR